MAGQKFEFRPGAIDFGKDYEYVMAAHHALRFAMDDSVLSCSLSTNNKDMGAFDDLVLEVEYRDGECHLYALQLKHKAKVDKKLTLNSFSGDKGDFSLRRYKRAYDKVHNIYLKKRDEFEAPFQHFHFLLYTNASLPNFVSYADGTPTKTDHLKIGQNGEICIVRHDQCVGRGLINVCDTVDTNYIFRFENNGDRELEGQFLQQFFLYVKQKSAKDIKWAVGRMIFKHFPNCDEEVVSKILEYFRNWYRGDYGSFKLTKWDLKVKLAEYLVAPFVPQLMVGSWQDADTHKWNLLAESMIEFDVVWLQDFDGPLDQIWVVILGEFRLRLSKYAGSWTRPIPEFTTMRAMELMQLPVATQLENFTELSLKDAYLMMWQLNLIPLLVSVDDDQAWDVIQGAINLFKYEARKKKFVLLTKQNRDISKTFYSLHNLSDLMSSPSYLEILDKFQVSLQGGHPISLGALVEGGDLAQMITTSSLVKMASQVVTIGESASLKLPQPYVTRMVPKITLRTNVLRKVDDLFVVVCANVDLVHAEIDVDAVTIQDYLTLRRRTNTKEYGPKQVQLSQCKNAPTDKFIIVCTYISANQFDEICALNPNIPCHLVSLTSIGFVEWHGSSNSVTKLHKFRGYSDEFFADSTLGDKFYGPINVLCADPGMGKSVTLDYFKLLWSANQWVVKINLNTHVKLFRQELDDDSLAHRLLNTNGPNLESATVRSYIKRKKTIVLWDGFDELPSCSTPRVIDIILKFRDLGYRQWIASRNTFKNHLEQIFGTISLTLTQFSDDDQHQYVETRCLAKCKEYGYSVDEVHRMVDAVYEDMTVLFDCAYSDYSGVPLQIYMLTEISLRSSRKKMDWIKGEFMTVVDIYREFIRGKFDRLYHKADAKAQNYHMERIQERYKKMVLGQYEEAALKYTFDYAPNLTGSCAEMLDDIAASGDSLGLISHINSYKTPTFIHHTYKEFLAASWLSKNYQDNKDLVQDMYDVEGMSNVRLMFDILMVEKSQPLVAILVKNYTLLKGIDSNLGSIRDQMGRTALHLACSYGQRHPKLEHNEGEMSWFPWVSIGEEKDKDKLEQNDGKIIWSSGQRKQEDKDYLAIVRLLLDGGCDPLDCDQFLKWNAFHYADRTLSLAALNLLLECKTYPVEQLTNYDASSILHYCFKFNYDSLLDNLKDLPYVEYEGRHSSILQQAVDTQRFSLVAKLLEFPHYKAIVNELSFNQITPVGSAAGLGHLATIELLVANGAKLVGLPYPPIIFAVKGRHFHVVEELVRKHSVKVDEPNPYGRTAFLEAVRTGQLTLFQFLVESGADVNQIYNDFYDLNYFLNSHSMEAIKFLIDRKLDLNRKCHRFGETALHLVSRDCNIPVLKLLLESGADPTIKSNTGDVPLHTALFNGREEAALVLMRFDGRVRDELNNDGFTPLIYAARTGQQIAVQELLAMGADPDGAPFKYAIDNEDARCVQTLIAKGASVNSVDCTGFLPLSYAILNNDKTMINLLLDKGAQVNAKNREGVTPLHFAALKGRLEAARELLRMRADIDAPDNDGDTALMMASKAKPEQPLMVEWLLTSGARIDQDKQGQLLYTVAAMNNPYLLEVLLEEGLDVDATNKDGEYALHAAAIGCEDCVDVLLKWNPDLDAYSTQYQCTPLEYSIIFGNTSVTKKLVQAGASVNCVDHCDGPLHRAAVMGDLVSLVVLVEGGADVNAPCLSNLNKRPLHFAASSKKNYLTSTLCILAGQGAPNNLFLSGNYQVCVAELMETGADVNSKCDKGMTPLQLACARKRLNIVPSLLDLEEEEMNSPTDFITTLNSLVEEDVRDNCHPEVVDELLETGADVNAKCDNGMTPLQLTCAHKRLNIIPTLFDLEAEVNSVTDSSTTFSSLDEEDVRGNWLLSDDHAGCVTELIKMGADVNAKCDNGITPLHLACAGKRLTIVSTLLDLGAEVNAVTDTKVTPLHAASGVGAIQLVRLLVRKGATVNALDDFGRTPLSYAAEIGNHEILHYLMTMGGDVNFEAGPNLNSTPLIMAVAKGNISSIRQLLECGAAPNQFGYVDESLLLPGLPYILDSLRTLNLDTSEIKSTILDIMSEQASLIIESCRNPGDKDEMNSLMVACKYGNLAVVQLLIEHGADVNAVNSLGWTSLNIARQYKRQDVVDYLVNTVNLDNEMSLERRCEAASLQPQANFIASTSLHVTAPSSQLELLDLILNLSMGVDNPTVLEAIRGSSLDMVRRLRQHGAILNSVLFKAAIDINSVPILDHLFNNTKDKSIDSLFLYGCSTKHIEGVQYLIEQGADVNTTDNEGCPALSLACQEGYPEVVNFLLQNGANINKPDSEGRTAIFHAISRKTMEVTRLVVDWGASVLHQDEYGDSALHHAISSSRYNEKIVKFLIDRGACVNQCNSDGTTPLHSAADAGYLESAKCLIDAGADIHQVDKFNRTTLYWACTKKPSGFRELFLDLGVEGDVVNEDSKKCPGVVELFVNLGVEVDAVNKNGNTALFLAAAYGLTSVVRYLRSKGARIHVVDNQGYTPLHDAASNGHLEVVKCLVEMGADVNWRNNDGKTPLDLTIDEEVAQHLLGAVQSRSKVISGRLDPEPESTFLDFDCHSYLLESPDPILGLRTLDIVRRPHQHGAILNSDLPQEATDVNDVLTLDHLFNNAKDKSLDSLLLDACITNDVHNAEYFIEHGADINTTDSEGCPVFSLACYEGHTEMVTFLLENGADVDKPDSAGRTVIFYAIESENWEVINLVVNRGASVQVQDIKGNSPLHYAVWLGTRTIVKFLIARGAPIDQRNRSGITPLHLAATSVSLELAKYLIDAGADVHQVDNFNITTLYRACTKQCLGLVELFVDLGVEVDVVNENGNTALFSAAANGLTSVVRYLRSKGARIHVVDNQGDTPLHDAASNGHLEVVKCLVEMGADVNWRNNNGKTPLDLTINEEVAQHLLGAGCEATNVTFTRSDPNLS